MPQRIAYDNSKLAVSRVLIGSQRDLTTRFRALCSHYLFEASFCRPGEGHDKGGVEARGKAICLQHLVPIPHGADLDEINARLNESLEHSATTKRNAEGRTIAERFAEEKPRMLPLSARPFDACATQLAIVSPRATVRPARPPRDGHRDEVQKLSNEGQEARLSLLQALIPLG